jgi:processive 1,2-diacylglycerol beta-glucosyltransferase
MKALIENSMPDLIACTQAFPCGMVADYKTTFKSGIPLVGVLTDFYPHSYWIYETVDRYIVASDEAKAKLIENGIPPDRINIFGIPLDISFAERSDLSSIRQRLGLVKGITTILIMGGSGGLGPIKKMVASLNRISSDIQIIVVTGTNSKLCTQLNRHIKNFKKKIVIIGYADNVNELMSISDLVVTKPGGLTVSEALAKGLGIVIINPIPGQEAKNTQFLLQKQAAIKAANEEELAILVDTLCRMPYKVEAMKKASANLGKPHAAQDIAKMIMEL